MLEVCKCIRVTTEFLFIEILRSYKSSVKLRRVIFLWRNYELSWNFLFFICRFSFRVIIYRVKNLDLGDLEYFLQSPNLVVDFEKIANSVYHFHLERCWHEFQFIYFF